MIHQISIFEYLEKKENLFHCSFLFLDRNQKLFFFFQISFFFLRFSNSTSMAAMEMMVEEDLRFSRDFPLLECAFDVAIHGQESNSPAGVQMLAVYDEEVQERFGNVQKMIHATERLLEVAILKGQESRIEQLEDFRVRLESLPLQCSELLGKKVTSAEIQLQLDPNRVYLDDIDDGVHLGLEEVKQGEGEESDDEDDLLDCPICFEDYKPAEMRFEKSFFSFNFFERREREIERERKNSFFKFKKLNFSQTTF